MSTAPNLQFVILVDTTGRPVTIFETDRSEFPAVATHDRDRIFHLDFVGDLGSLAGFPTSVDGAVYIEVEAWRISCRSINMPKPVRRRKTAKILPFRARGGE
jgi:hypothetical protein